MTLQDWQSGVPSFLHSSGKKPISLRLSIENCVLMASYYEPCSEMSEEQFHKYMELLPIFDVSIQEILKDMLYTYTVHRHRDARKNGAVFTRLHMAESTSLLNILNRSYQAYYEERFLDCFRDSLYLEQTFLKQGNYNRLLDVLMPLSFCMQMYKRMRPIMNMSKSSLPLLTSILNSCTAINICKACINAGCCIMK